MLKTVLAAAAALGFAALGACSQQSTDNAEEIGERMDSAYEEAAQGAKDLSDGPMENAGEKLDDAAREAGADVEPDAVPPADTAPPG